MAGLSQGCFPGTSTTGMDGHGHGFFFFHYNMISIGSACDFLHTWTG